MSGDVTAGPERAPDALGDELSEEQRAAAFAPRESSARIAALRAGRTPIPPKFIWWVVAAFMVLGVGGGVAERYVGNFGAASTAFVTPTTSPILGAATSRVSDQILGLKGLNNAAASPFTLQDQFGRPWSLAGARGKVVVLTFYNVNCNDVCPVLGTEIKEATALLGANAAKVDFVIINTDPLHLGPTSSPRALSVPGLESNGSTFFLTGTLPHLNSIWTRYGVSIKVISHTNAVVHNNVMYFIDASGRLRLQAIPFGNESRTGTYTLGTHDIRQFAQGVAATASSLIR